MVFAAGFMRVACAPPTAAPAPVAAPAPPETFAPSEQCKGCHIDIWEQHTGSMHARSSTNPVYHAQRREFFDLKAAEPDRYVAEPACDSCHAPVAFLMGADADAAPLDHELSGISCDFCHRVEGYDGDTPASGNHIARPGAVKLGPFLYEADHHRAYSPLHASSAFCATCHSSRNGWGVPIRTTYEEWADTPYATGGIQCQHCHMASQAVLGSGARAFASGRAAHMNLGTEAPVRRKLFSHTFRGPTALSRVDKATQLSIEGSAPISASAKQFAFTVEINNSRAAHHVPSGSAELRTMWMDVHIFLDGAELPGRLAKRQVGFGVTGGTAEDAWILGRDFPAGLPIYRAVFSDINGDVTLRSYEAVEREFDNRIRAGERRRERFIVTIPAGSAGPLTVRAELHYQRYPVGFANQMGVPEISSLVISSAATRFPIEAR